MIMEIMSIFRPIAALIAGAAIGYFTSKIELNQSRGLLLRPFIHDTDAANRAPILQFSHSF